MKKKRILIMWLFITSVCLSVFSQTDSIEKYINIEDYGYQVASKYNQLNGYLQVISQKDKRLTTQQQIEADNNKNAYIKEALKFFIGEGTSFLDSAGVKHPAVIVSICTITIDGKARIRDMKLETFFQHLKYLRYKNVQIDFVEVYYPIKVLSMDGDMPLFTMERRVYPIMRPNHRNCTPQTITMKLNKKNVDGRDFWPIYFGDIKLTVTL